MAGIKIFYVKTIPVFVPRTSLGLRPASTIHSYTLSNSKRWRGSRELTWFGEIPKKMLSNLSASKSVPDRLGNPWNPEKGAFTVYCKNCDEYFIPGLNLLSFAVTKSLPS